jgi:hypothetical protein
VCNALDIPITKWPQYKEVVRKAIRVKRMICSAALKKEYICEWSIVVVLL